MRRVNVVKDQALYKGRLATARMNVFDENFLNESHSAYYSVKHDVGSIRTKIVENKYGEKIKLTYHKDEPLPAKTLEDIGLL